MKTQILFALLLCLTLTAKSPSNGHVESSEPDEFQKADIYSITDASSSSAASVAENQGRILDIAGKSSTGTPVRSIDSIFSRLPDSHELDDLIKKADSVAIVKTVQTLVSDDSIPCSQIIFYLLELQGRIRTAIEIKTFIADSLQVVIDGAKAEIARLEDEIDRLEDEKKALWLEELRDRLAKLVRQLENCYQEMNAIESQIAPNEAEVAGYERQIQILMKSSDAERNRIANDRLKLTEVEADIKNLENRLRELRDTRDNIRDSIAKSENIIKDNERRIDDAREKIKHLEDEIRRLRDKVDSLRAECVNLEIQVERLRTDIAVAEAKEDRINDQIDELNRRINIEERKLDEEELRDIRGMIDNLNKALPNIAREIDRQYYYCYGEGAVTVEETGDVVVYIVRGESFGNYLLSVYGQSVKADHLSKAQYRLHRHDIFSPVWIAKFGYPMVTDAFDSPDFSFNGDFTCLQPSKASSGYGKIKEIRGNRMVVDHNGDDEVLHFGACSRLQGTKHLPEVGQNIAFKGVPSRAGGYNIYGATCW